MSFIFLFTALLQNRYGITFFIWWLPACMTSKDYGVTGDLVIWLIEWGRSNLYCCLLVILWSRFLLICRKDPNDVPIKSLIKVISHMIVLKVSNGVFFLYFWRCVGCTLWELISELKWFASDPFVAPLFVCFDAFFFYLWNLSPFQKHSSRQVGLLLLERLGDFSS